MQTQRHGCTEERSAITRLSEVGRGWVGAVAVKWLVDRGSFLGGLPLPFQATSSALTSLTGAQYANHVLVFGKLVTQIGQQCWGWHGCQGCACVACLGMACVVVLAYLLKWVMSSEGAPNA
jgi:hypothetical protein